jgi:hypothetical protein
MAGLLGLDELFEVRHFDREVIVLCVRWYTRSPGEPGDSVWKRNETSGRSAFRWRRDRPDQFAVSVNRCSSASEIQWTRLFRGTAASLGAGWLLDRFQPRKWRNSGSFSPVVVRDYRAPPILRQSRAIWARGLKKRHKIKLRQGHTLRDSAVFRVAKVCRESPSYRDVFRDNPFLSKWHLVTRQGLPRDVGTIHGVKMTESPFIDLAHP